ncbi:hypothetical protein FHS96_002249 [Sphingomonas zeicaulis]|uniref:hypothetical protein n=1 Tax=Sphingomonas zeicaulis TaxID=1632740 RepID=UPI003D24F763
MIHDRRLNGQPSLRLQYAIRVTGYWTEATEWLAQGPFSPAVTMLAVDGAEE